MTSEGAESITNPTPYERWMLAQEVPIIHGYFAADVPNQPMERWDRLGCPATFLHLRGMEGRTAMYAVEIPPGGETRPIKHMYEQIVFVLKGQGRAEVRDAEGHVSELDWQETSMFGIPLNASYTLKNTGSEPAYYLAATTAPLVFDLFHSEDFVFNTNLEFKDRFDGRADYYALDSRYGETDHPLWDANLITDVANAQIPAKEYRGSGYGSIQFEPAGNTLIGHMAQYPSGRYAKAHHHGGGALLVILRSTGYTLLWPSELGLRPFSDGKGERVVRVDWKPGTVFSPPTGWFHQHFNSGPEPARQLALRYGSTKFPMGIHKAAGGVTRSTSEGGTQIEYEDEDPEIRRLFERETAARGVTVDMPAVSYR